jgi:tellurite resistance protein
MTDELANGDAAGGPQTPPATFEFLIHTLFTQALMALGRIPNPITKQSLKNLATARHFIDTLAMLEAKTQGNLTTEERQLLEEIQHQLRTMYVEARA